MPDRIEIATYLTATAMTGGEITVKAVNPNTIDKVLQKLELAGAKISKMRFDMFKNEKIT